MCASLPYMKFPGNAMFKLIKMVPLVILETNSFQLAA